MDTEAFWAGREQELEEYARLALRVGVNLQHGQDVSLLSYVEHAPLVRAIARVAYEEGARRLDPYYVDVHVRRETAAHASEEVVGWTPPWMLQRVEEEAQRRTALINTAGEPQPDLFAGVEPGRVASSVLPDLCRARWSAFDHGRMPWTIVAFPTAGVGDAGIRRAGPRAALGRGAPDRAPGRAGRSRHVARAHQDAAEPRRAAERAPLRRRALPRPRHRPHGRTAAAGRLDRGGLETAWGQLYVPNLGTDPRQAV